MQRCCQPESCSCLSAEELPILFGFHLHMQLALLLHLRLLPSGADGTSESPVPQLWHGCPQGAGQHRPHGLRFFGMLV